MKTYLLPACLMRGTLNSELYAQSQMEELGPNISAQVDFPVIGIGASARGLEAVTSMFRKMVPGQGIAYVLVMHFDPNHESVMVELLSRKTQVEVRQIKDGDPIDVDVLHVIPPGRSLIIEDGHFCLRESKQPRGVRRPIDLFFGSLASAQREKCACVILSGTGADGTAGIEIAKDLGGVIAVQSPEEARYDGMPFSAISTKMIDFTLPAEEIIPRLLGYFEGHQDPDWPDLDQGDETGGTQEALARIFELISKTTGNDFSGYKPSMLLRRLKRRMQICELTHLGDYLTFLEDNLDERAALAKDFLINITSFFRDWEHFEVMRAKVIKPMIEKADDADEVRIWVPGCSSGQEAYSIAMLVDRTCRELGKRPLIQIFATDIDEEMLTRARRGVYLLNDYDELPKTYQQEYTHASDGHFEIDTSIRHMVRFSQHNIIQHPPFSKIDLISCRNLLIYLRDDLQVELFPVLYFSLRADGHLFLGNLESITRQTGLFSDVDQGARLFQRVENGRRVHLHMPLGQSMARRSQQATQRRMAVEQDFPGHQSLPAHEEIYQEYAPPFVQVSADGRVIGSSGELGLFLVTRPGEERDLYSLLRQGLKDVATELHAKVLKTGDRQALEDVKVRAPFGVARTDVIAHPMRDGTVAIIFAMKDQLQPTIKRYAVPPVSGDQRISDLQDKLSQTQRQLKDRMEEVGTANEELKSSNEEMMSMNEELQSENEELTTANEKLKNKIDELTLANADLDNFQRSASLAMLVVDRSLRIRQITEAAGAVLPIKQTDKGRFLNEFNLGLEGADLAKETISVMKSRDVFSETTSTSMPGKEGSSYFTRITPYFCKDGTVEGATIALTDISQEADLRQQLELEKNRLALAMQVGRMGLAEMDAEKDEVVIDQTLSEQCNVPKSGRMPMAEWLTNIHPDDQRNIAEVLSHAIETESDYEIDFRVMLPGDETRWIRSHGTPYTSRDGTTQVVGPTIDITDVTNFNERRELMIREMSHRIKNLFAVVSSLVRLAPKRYDSRVKMADELAGRITSLARVYDLARKKASFDEVQITELIDTIVMPHVVKQSFIKEGPDVTLGGDTLNTLTMIIHEMTTNAFKYGALSKPSGGVRLAWRADPDGLTNFIWEETVPNFSVPEDATSGFGSSLLQGAAQQLGGSYERTFTDQGVLVKFSLTLT
ncbi:MAG: PAS domain-containing protein [Rhodobacteraceae bacterium]|nr:PAS domain-containing protein [Paracoccaceae bacterium]